MKTTIFFALLSILVFNGYSQTLDEQFKELRDDSETFKVYKVIKQTELNSFWNTVMDSVGALKNEITKAEETIQNQSSEITNQKNIISTKDQEIEGLEFQTTHITVLGIDLYKEAFIVISFSIMGLLVITIVILFGRFRSSQTVAKQKVIEWKKVTQELEKLKKESLEKQMKLRRELQTQINKLNEIWST